MELYNDIEFSKEEAMHAARAAGRKVVAMAAAQACRRFFWD